MIRTGTRRVVALGAVAFGLLACLAWGDVADGAAREAELIAILGSEAPLNEKADACRELGRAGTATAVPRLAALLADAKLGHMARYALETIPGQEVDAALRAALASLDGLPLIGVIGSVGVRRDAAAVPALAAHLAGGTPAVQQAAARALGQVGGAAALDLLSQRLPAVQGETRLAVVEGILRAAESVAATGDGAAAMAAYDRLRGLPDAPHQVRTAALRGGVLARGDAGIPLLLEALRGSDAVLVRAAVRTSLELPGPAVGQAMAGVVRDLPIESQTLVLLALGKRRDAAALPVLFDMARGGEEADRLTAVKVIAEIGHPSAVAVFIGLHDSPDKDIAQAARDGLAALDADGVDAALMEMLRQENPETRRTAISILGQRRVEAALPALFRAAREDVEENRVAAVRAISEVAGGEAFKDLLSVLVGAESAAVRRAAEEALAALAVRLARPSPEAVTIHKALYGALPDGKTLDVTARVAEMVKAGILAIDATNRNFTDPTPGVVKGLLVEYSVGGMRETVTARENATITIAAGATPDAYVTLLEGALAQAQTAAKPSVLRILRSTRSGRALDAVRGLVGDAGADAGVRDEAIGILCAWPTVDALPDLLALAKDQAATAKSRILALRGCFRLIPLQNTAPAAKVKAIAEVLDLAERAEEKRLGLAELAKLPVSESLAAIGALLGDPALKDEACLAAVAVAEGLVGSQPQAAAASMRQVLTLGTQDAVAKRAREVLNRAGAAAKP